MTGEVCEACNGRGYRDVTYEWRGSVQDGETGCSECCPHARLMLLPGPGIGCADCGSWFKSREDAEREGSGDG